MLKGPIDTLRSSPFSFVVVLGFQAFRHFLQLTDVAGVEQQLNEMSTPILASVVAATDPGPANAGDDGSGREKNDRDRGR